MTKKKKALWADENSNKLCSIGGKVMPIDGDLYNSIKKLVESKQNKEFCFIGDNALIIDKNLYRQMMRNGKNTEVLGYGN